MEFVPDFRVSGSLLIYTKRSLVEKNEYWAKLHLDSENSDLWGQSGRGFISGLHRSL